MLHRMPSNNHGACIAVFLPTYFTNIILIFLSEHLVRAPISNLESLTYNLMQTISRSTVTLSLMRWQLDSRRCSTCWIIQASRTRFCYQNYNVAVTRESSRVEANHSKPGVTGIHSYMGTISRCTCFVLAQIWGFFIGGGCVLMNIHLKPVGPTSLSAAWLMPGNVLDCPGPSDPGVILISYCQMTNFT